MKRMKSPKGFTFIELLIVIAIIGTLASIILVTLGAAREKANKTKVHTELKSVISAVTVARFEAQKTLIEITGSSCSNCPCHSIDLRGIPDTHVCQKKWDQAMTKISDEVKGGVEGIDELKRDPWNSPYMFDENEGEHGSDSCLFDHIKSAGPDGFTETADDFFYRIPHSEGFDHCPPL